MTDDWVTVGAAPQGAAPVDDWQPVTSTTSRAAAPAPANTSDRVDTTPDPDGAMAFAANTPGAASAVGGAVASKYGAGLSGAWEQLKADAVATLPDAKSKPAGFWDAQKQQFDQQISMGKLPLDAFNIGLSLLGIPQAIGAANNAVGQGVAQVLPDIPAHGGLPGVNVAKDLSDTLGTAEMFAGPDRGTFIPRAPKSNRMDAPSDFVGMKDITPAGPPGAPAAAPWRQAHIDPIDIHPGDEDSPIDTSIIAAGRKIIREATEKPVQDAEMAGILAKNGWPAVGTRFTADNGSYAPRTGTITGASTAPIPGTDGAMGDMLHGTLDDTGEMFSHFKQEIEAAGIAITPQQLQQAGLPLDLATNPSAPGQPAPVAPVPDQAATPVAETAAPAQDASQPAPQGMPVDLFQQPRITATEAITPTQASPPPTTGDGTQAAPITVTHPDHLAQASDQVNTAPTEAQKSAGNYEKGHIKLHGMDIAIENPAGSTRSGVDAGGKPWSVEMPAAYGYVKRTTGADGDQVDVYVGHNPTSPKVFVIDQQDAKTGAFDEHKAMLGFDTRGEAVAAYNNAFSDGLGPMRNAGVREMNTLQFKNLLNSGVLDKPVAGGKEITSQPNDTSVLTPKTAPEEITPPAPIVKIARAPLVPTRETSVLENIRRLGGIKILNNLNHPTKEGQNILAALKDVPNLGRYINNKNGMRPDTIRESMKAQGWFGSNPEHGADIQHLYDLIDKEVREGPQFHPESDRAKAVAGKAIADDNARALAEVHGAVKAGGGKPISDADAAQIVANMGEHDKNAPEAVSDHFDKHALRLEYEHDAEATHQGPTAGESVPERTGTVDRLDGQDRSEPAPDAAETGRGEAGGHPATHDAETPLATERDAEGLNQTIVPGADKSAQQIAKARDASGHGRSTTSVQQKDAGGMFAPKVEAAKDLFASDNEPKLSPGRARPGAFDWSNPGGGSRTAKIGPTEITYGIGKDKTAELTLIRTAKAGRNSGAARAALEAFLKGADEHGYQVRLTADPMESGVSKLRLEKFYKSLGFKNNSGRSKDFSTRAGMIREPIEPKLTPSDTQTGSANGRDFSIVAPQTPEFEAQRKLVAEALRKNLDKIGLTDVGIKIADSIAMVRNGETVTTANGLHWRDIITVALHDDALETGWHEAIHALYTMGLFKKTEWAMLQAKAKSTWRDQFGVDAKWEHMKLSEEALNEEAIAEAYRAHRSGGAKGEAASDKQTGIFGRLLDRLRNALSAIRDAFNGLGFRKPEDIFASIDKGEVGGRSRPNGPTGQEHEPSFSPDKPVDDHQAAVDTALDGYIAATARKMGWEGEPTSLAMTSKAFFMPKGAARNELYRNAEKIKALEDQRSTPFKSGLSPVKGDGETKVRGVAQSMADKAAKSGHVLDDLQTYDRQTQDPIMARSRKFVADDANYEQAKAVAMGREPAPYGNTPESMLIAVEERAAREDDYALLNQLKSSALVAEGTVMGQRIAMNAQRDPLSPVTALKEVQQAREVAAKARGTDAPKAKRKAIKDMLDDIKKGADESKGAKSIKLQAFINSVICKA